MSKYANSICVFQNTKFGVHFAFHRIDYDVSACKQNCKFLFDGIRTFDLNVANFLTYSSFSKFDCTISKTKMRRVHIYGLKLRMTKYGTLIFERSHATRMTIHCNSSQVMFTIFGPIQLYKPSMAIMALPIDFFLSVKYHIHLVLLFAVMLHMILYHRKRRI